MLKNLILGFYENDIKKGKICITCGQYKALTEFDYSPESLARGSKIKCRDCRQSFLNNKKTQPSKPSVIVKSLSHKFNDKNQQLRTPIPKTYKNVTIEINKFMINLDDLNPSDLDELGYRLMNNINLTNFPNEISSPKSSTPSIDFKQLSIKLNDENKELTDELSNARQKLKESKKSLLKYDEIEIYDTLRKDLEARRDTLRES